MVDFGAIYIYCKCVIEFVMKTEVVVGFKGIYNCILTRSILMCCLCILSFLSLLQGTLYFVGTPHYKTRSYIIIL